MVQSTISLVCSGAGIEFIAVKPSFMVAIKFGHLGTSLHFQRAHTPQRAAQPVNANHPFPKHLLEITHPFADWR